MKAPLSRHPPPYVQPINGSEARSKRGVRCPSSACDEARARRGVVSRGGGGGSQRRVQAAIGQTPGQLIDLHYVNYSG